MKHLLSLSLSLDTLFLSSLMLDVVFWLENHLLTCPIKAMSGIDCPGCGMQRAFILLLKGEFVASITTHPSVIPMIMMICFLPLHLKFDFKHGSKILVFLFILSAALTVINYAYKIFYSGLF